MPQETKYCHSSALATFPFQGSGVEVVDESGTLWTWGGSAYLKPVGSQKDPLTGQYVLDAGSRKAAFDKLRGATNFKQVATRCRVSGNSSNAVFQLASKSYHHARDEITSLKIGIPNWYVTSGVETAMGGPATVQASIEYPSGTVIGRFQFSGSLTGTAQDLQTIETDELTLSATIPSGAKFWVSIDYRNAAGIPFVYTDSIGADQANGDVAQYDVSGVPNVTATGAALTNTTTGVGFYPVFIVANTSVRSLALAGDSIVAGKGDSPSDNTGFGGFAERAVGPTYPYINIANAGASVDSFTTTTSYLRRQLLAYTDAVFFAAGINNVVGGMGSFSILDNIVKARQSVPYMDFYAAPMLPISTGAWSLANGSDQTNSANEYLRTTANDQLVGSVCTTFTSVIDTRTAVAHASAAGKWIANTTADGVHPNQAGHIAIAASIQAEEFTA